ncbi:MAG: hypothetical protein OXP66_17020 [Candidatus Tectomicrobia bacterium]|nr:hypothetical protein [Candidatus Tectomicrobia bacterium]
MDSGLTDPQQAAELDRALRAMEPPVCPPGLVPALTSALLASVDPPRGLSHLLRFLSSAGDAHVFWEACRGRSEFLPHLAAVFAASRFLSGVLWRDPQLALWLCDEALYAPPPAPDALAEQLDRALQGRAGEEQLADVLLRFTQRHLLRLGARDVNRLSNVDETTAGLAALADCVLQAAVRVCRDGLTAMHGPPVYTDDDGVERPCRFCVVGMGKLGGGELNFSSDIDLMYVYTSYQGQTRGVVRDGERQGRISNHEYFVALARRLTSLISGRQGSGQIFRVDLRLRPDGTQGQLALALLAYEAYYARLGQPWEQMALIKARPVAGDADLGREFMELVQPFIYRRNLDAQGLEQLRSMKRQIDAQMADRNESRTNVKLGRGGIREIEFLIQLPQLLFGGRRPELQERNSLRALDGLRDAGLLDAESETLLRDTYTYLRRVEHLLQMEQGSQTHTLPRGEDAQRRLARHGGHDDWEAFYEDYLARTEAVHSLFAKTFRME